MRCPKQGGLSSYQAPPLLRNTLLCNSTKTTSPVPNHHPPNPDRPCQYGLIRPPGASGRRIDHKPWDKRSAPTGAVDASDGLLADPDAPCGDPRNDAVRVITSSSRA